MKKRPQSPIPGPASESVVVIVKKNNTSTMAALFIVALLLVGTLWIFQGSTKAGVPAASGRLPEIKAAAAVPQGKPSTGPSKTSDVVFPASPVKARASEGQDGPFGRPTFFEPTE